MLWHFPDIFCHNSASQSHGSTAILGPGGNSMLTSGTLTGFMITRDYDQARAFYEGKLGFPFVSQDQFALVVQAGQHQIRIVKMPDHKPLRSTVLGWEVKDIEAAVRWLKERGVATEKYPFVEDKETGIWNAPGG